MSVNHHAKTADKQPNCVVSTTVTVSSSECTENVLWLVRWTTDRAVQVRVLAGYIVLCSWARHLNLTVPLSTQMYKWVTANLMVGVTLRWTSIPSRGE